MAEATEATEATEADRGAVLARQLTQVRAAIDEAARSADRDRSDVTLIAITKTFPISDAALLTELSVFDLGENRDQEAKSKAAELAELTSAPVRWHFVGQLQSNKARSVARYAAAIHSLDRISVIDALDDAVARLERAPIQAFIQVNLDDAAPQTSNADAQRGRGGASADELEALADRIAAASGFELAGVMAVAPMGADPRRAFDRLLTLSQRLRRAHPAATAISAGMSGDFAEAIAAGATHVRLGSALLGPRPQVVG